MKASKFSDTQKAFIVKRVEDGVTVEEICWEAENRLRISTGARSMRV
ncbi:hypothetical protein IWQ49_006718 [Labrenzia sp. EL_126]|nr:hypothetical protein [Labrenzia sp. EL_126]